MVVIDISAETTRNFVTWDGVEKGYEPELISEIAKGEVCNVSVMHQGAHTGTHMDAPFHFIENGKTIEQLDLDVLIGPASVSELYGRAVITAPDLKSLDLPSGTSRLILKTDNTTNRLIFDPKFHKDYVAVAPDAAQWIVDNGIKLIGIDYLSIGPYGSDNIETHRILLSNEVVVIETLNLSHVQAGNYTLIAAPPKLSGLEGAPVRALLIQE
jgi:arylformamidase